MSKNILGALCMVASVTFFSLMDIIVKVTDDYAVGEILFFRALFGFIPIFFLIPKGCLLYTSPSPRDLSPGRMPASA